MKKKITATDANKKTLEIMTETFRILGASGAIIGRSDREIVLAILLFPKEFSINDVTHCLFTLSIEKVKGYGSLRVFSEIMSDTDFVFLSFSGALEQRFTFEGIIPIEDENDWPYLAEVRKLILEIKPINPQINELFDRIKADMSNDLNELLGKHRSEILNLLFSSNE